MASSERVTIPKGWKLTKVSITTSKDGNGERKIDKFLPEPSLYFVQVQSEWLGTPGT